jgi:hypothetical protein
MTKLFRRLQPAKKFRITKSAIAQLLKIPQHLIVRVECWAYVLFIHRQDKGGQFISYRKLQQWQNAVACQIQNCSTSQQLRLLWMTIEDDCKKHKKQYNNKYHRFCTQSGQNALKPYGTSKNRQLVVETKTTSIWIVERLAKGWAKGLVMELAMGGRYVHFEILSGLIGVH